MENFEGKTQRTGSVTLEKENKKNNNKKEKE